MSEAEPQDKLAERMARMKPSEPSKRRRGLNPYALSAVTAVAGAGVGAWLVLAAPAAPPAAPVLETASVSGFQGEEPGTEGFMTTKAKPQVTPVVVDRSEETRLKAEIETLNAKIARFKGEAATPDPKLEGLKAEVEHLTSEAQAQSAKLSDLERENLELKTALDTKALIEGDLGVDDQMVKDAETLAAAQINSEMVALRASGDSGSGSEGGFDSHAAYPPGAGSAGPSGNEAFRTAGAKAAEVREAEIIADPSHTIMQGTLIEAALETALSTDLAGNVSALVSHDVWSFDMSRVLIPRGSRLYGRYESDVASGQRRVLIAWDRIVTTTGQSVSLAAYGTDRVGRSGLPGKVRTHFLQRFGTAALISVIGAVPTLAASRYAENELASETAENVGEDFGGAVSDVMADYLRIPPTISVDQGAIVMVRVDADLAFN